MKNARRFLSNLSRTSILCIGVVGLLLFIVVLTRVHPGADAPPVSRSASSLHRASAQVRFKRGSAVGKDEPSSSVVLAEHAHKHHSVSESPQHDPLAAITHSEKHGGRHPQLHATQRHDEHDADHADHRLLHPVVAPAKLKHEDTPPLAPGFVRHKMGGAKPPVTEIAKPVTPTVAKLDVHTRAMSPADKATPAYLHDTAIVTLATGDEAARMAVALVASLRDVKTKVPNIVILATRGGAGSKDCHDEKWKKAHGREHIVDCSGGGTIAEEILSERYVTALKAMGAQIKVVDPIPRTPYTSLIPGEPGHERGSNVGGGGRWFWAAAFDKLLVFNMTEYRKLLWMDADTLVLKNVDHLLKEPTFTAAFTYNCCNGAASAKISGGLWVVEPSVETGVALWKLMSAPVPGTDGDAWHWGDMQVVRHFFGAPRKESDIEPLWPSVDDNRYGLVPNFEMLPEVRNMTRRQVREHWLSRVVDPVKRAHVGLLPGAWDGKKPIWRILDPTYDQCIGNCECLPGRDAPLLMKTVHYSCMQNGLKKPGGYESEKELFAAVSDNALSCSRFWFALWLEKFSKGMRGTGVSVGAELLEGKGKSGLPEPFWKGSALPIFDRAHDDEVLTRRLKKQQEEEAEEAKRSKKAFVRGEKVAK